MRRYSSMTVALLVLSTASQLRADEEFDKLLDEFSEARTAWRARLNEASPDGDAATNPGSTPNPAREFLPRFKAYAQKHAGTPDAIPALMWIINDAILYLDAGDRKAAGQWAVEQLTENHAADPTLKTHLPQMRYAYYRIGTEPLIALYERVVELNKDKEAAAAALFNHAFTLYRDPAAMIPGQKARQETEQALQLFRRAVKDYPQTPGAEQAAGYIYEAEHLQIGMTAPEIVGTDVDGQEIRLSQFRGQVVVLDFWGFW